MGRWTSEVHPIRPGGPAPATAGSTESGSPSCRPHIRSDQPIVKADSGSERSKSSRAAFDLTGAAETIRQFVRERPRLPEVARLQVCLGYLDPKIPMLDHARPEITHQRQHRTDRAACGDEMNATDEFTALFDSQRFHGR